VPPSARPETTMCQKLLLVIPCYNEAERLPKDAFRRHLEADPYLYLVFVDDGSQDGTAGMLREFCREFETRTTLISYLPNKGKSEAVRLGVNHALANLHPDVVGFWDADLATPLEELKAFLDVLDKRPEIEMVFGSRVKLLGREITRLPVRHYLGRVFATIASQVLGIPIYDTQCGAKLFRVTPYLHYVFDQAFLSKWIFDVEIIARFQQLYFGDEGQLERAIYEYPLQTWIDVAGSKVKPRHFFVAVTDLFRIKLQVPKAFAGRAVRDCSSVV
jgi:dolichyl-phosphate beta-glucosyltransferase